MSENDTKHIKTDDVCGLPTKPSEMPDRDFVEDHRADQKAEEKEKAKRNLKLPLNHPSVEAGLLDPYTGRFKKGHKKSGGMKAKIHDAKILKRILFNVPRSKWNELREIIWEKALVSKDYKYVKFILEYKLGRPVEQMLLDGKSEVNYTRALGIDDSAEREAEFAAILKMREAKSDAA